MEPLFSIDYPKFEEHGTPPCAETDPDAFFTDDTFADSSLRPGKGRYLYEYEAKVICASCPYRLECLAYALKHDELQGIWGGANEGQRRLIRRGINVSLRLPSIKRR